MIYIFQSVFSNSLLINFGLHQIQTGGVKETYFSLAYTTNCGVVSTCGANIEGYTSHSRYPYYIDTTHFVTANANQHMWSWIAIGY